MWINFISDNIWYDRPFLQEQIFSKFDLPWDHVRYKVSTKFGPNDSTVLTFVCLSDHNSGTPGPIYLKF